MSWGQLNYLDLLGFISTWRSVTFSHLRDFFSRFYHSRSMSMAFTREKKEVTLQFALMLLASSSIPIRILVLFIGRVVAFLPGLTYGRAFYRDMEFQNADSSKANIGNFDAYISLNPDSLSGIVWWRYNIMQSWASISPHSYIHLC